MLNNKKDCFVLGLQADTHHSTNDFDDGIKICPATDYGKIFSFSELNKNVKLNAVCNLGDMVRGYEFDPVEYTRRDLKEAVVMYLDDAEYPVFLIAGNHDNGVLWTKNEVYGTGNRSLDEILLPAERYEAMVKPLKEKADIKDYPGKLYYYCDLDGVRIVALDTDDLDYKEIAPSDVDINNHKISDEQILWLENEALDTKLPVIVLCHVPLMEELLQGSCHALGDDRVVEILSSFKADGGDVIAVLSGHMHFKDSALYNGINYIGIEMGYDKGEIMTVLKESRKIVFKDLSDGTEREFDY